MHRLTLGFVLAFISCSGHSSPSQPSPPPSTVSPQAVTSFSLQGSVHDTAFRTLSDALVEIVDGVRAGDATRTDATGRFWFPGEFSEHVMLRASKAGHHPATTRTTPSGVRAHVIFELDLVESPMDISGEYSFSVSGGPSCVDVPESFRTRSYNVSVAPYSSASSFRVNFKHPNVVDAWGPTIQIRMAGSFMHMIADGDWQAGIIEDVPSGWITFAGIADGLMTGSGVSGSFIPGTAGYKFCPGPRPGKGAGYTTWDCAAPLYCPTVLYSLQRR